MLIKKVAIVIIKKLTFSECIRFIMLKFIKFEKIDFYEILLFLY